MLSPLRVLYEDGVIICFDKPAGLPTQPTLDPQRPDLYSLAKAQLSQSADVYLGMHHRLDRDTSGVILFTLDQQYNAYVAEQFREHRIQKSYVAVVHGQIKTKQGRIESFLAEVARKGKQAKYGSVKSGGKKAISEYIVLATNGIYSLIDANLMTGRTHQLRVHFSEMGHPIVGDTLYGSPTVEYHRHKRHLLHAHALAIKHPVTHNEVRIESPIPESFRKCIR